MQISEPSVRAPQLCEDLVQCGETQWRALPRSPLVADQQETVPACSLCPLSIVDDVLVDRCDEP